MWLARARARVINAAKHVAPDDARQPCLHAIVLRGFRTAAASRRPVIAYGFFRFEPEEPRVVPVAGVLDGNQLNVAMSIRADERHVLFARGPPVLGIAAPEERHLRVMTHPRMPFGASVRWTFGHVPCYHTQP